MQLKAHFYSINKVIIQHLQAAQSEILLAVTWFTNPAIFEVLCKQARTGVRVSVVMIGDKINQGPGALNFQRICNLGGKVVFLPFDGTEELMMHHTFCVLDGVIVITGVFNWGNEAKRNDESIIIVTEAPEFAAKYCQVLHDMLLRSGNAGRPAETQMDARAIRHRLELVRNLILLGEQEDLLPHLGKLHSVADQLHLQPMLQALARGAYKAALEFIDAYLHDSSALVLHEDTDVPRLQFYLEALELRLVSISDEKSDLERRLIIFNRRYSDVLGLLLVKILEAQATLAHYKAAASRQRAVEDQAATQEAEFDAQEADQCQQDWQEYRREYAEQQAKAPPSMLSVQEEAELKRLYRKACSRCHPDKFTDEKKGDAHRVFVILQEIYNRNDLEALRELYATLKAGGLHSGSQSSNLSRSDNLRAVIAELQYRITEALREFRALYDSEGSALLRRAGETESDWSTFLAQQKQLFQAELESFQKRIAAIVVQTYISNNKRL